MYITSRKRERERQKDEFEMAQNSYISVAFSLIFCDSSMTMKATSYKCNPKLSSKDDLPGMFGSRNNPDQTVEYLNFRQTNCRIFPPKHTSYCILPTVYYSKICNPQIFLFIKFTVTFF